MSKKHIMVGAVSLGLLAGVATAAFAQTTTAATGTTTTHSADVAKKIACAGAAVNTREQALMTAVSTHTQAVNTAYSARATALQQAYTMTTPKDVKTAVNKAWMAFSTATKAARKAWVTSQKTAWTQFRTAAKACKAPGEVSDSAHMGSEISGD